ncbi:hypothetical protein BO70DRAFT_106955 [Aspergillus heteromorphus CBS 117.55]|uniref:Uncharacterized protein n=1 Tax=Aspergillus heteromorphus CBS 117.55 TaxID=1448321 RepID=A0A317VJE5_9EURO|nr:uncharacterized protein BO70DRAFT_106955 [Aspergillus heteromorphus CBS 117.55]PWY74436.1 hypothetical protein BO70DRAFT_106955 [Aspergillus heteromorphus CBS 117.55]
MADPSPRPSRWRSSGVLGAFGWCHARLMPLECEPVGPVASVPMAVPLCTQHAVDRRLVFAGGELLFSHTLSRDGEMMLSWLQSPKQVLLHFGGQIACMQCNVRHVCLQTKSGDI